MVKFLAESLIAVSKNFRISGRIIRPLFLSEYKKPNTVRYLASGQMTGTAWYRYLFFAYRFWHSLYLVHPGLWIRIHFLRIGIQRFFSMRIRIGIQPNKIGNKLLDEELK